MKKPVIGISLDFENNQGYSAMPYYALRENYISSVERAGGVPILLPFSQNIDSYIELIDGLIITGGNFDISPNLYGDSKVHNAVSVKENRTNFEKEISLRAIEKKMPILGICGGMQLLNVILGGTLIQHIPDEIEGCLEHEVKPYDESAHDILIKKDSLLSKLADGKEIIGANSSHHQAVKDLGKDLMESGITQDGVIEAIENRDYPFMVGVQWHPEYQITNLDKNLFSELVRKSM